MRPISQMGCSFRWQRMWLPNKMQGMRKHRRKALNSREFAWRWWPFGLPQIANRPTDCKLYRINAQNFKTSPSIIKLSNATRMKKSWLVNKTNILLFAFYSFEMSSFSVILQIEGENRHQTVYLNVKYERSFVVVLSLFWFHLRCELKHLGNSNYIYPFG